MWSFPLSASDDFRIISSSNNSSVDDGDNGMLAVSQRNETDAKAIWDTIEHAYCGN